MIISKLLVVRVAGFATFGQTGCFSLLRVRSHKPLLALAFISLKCMFLHDMV